MNLICHIKIPIEKDEFAEYLKAAAEKMHLATNEISILKILSKSLDMREKEQFFYIISLVVCTADQFTNSKKFPPFTEPKEVQKKQTSSKERPIIVGFGPAGMFAALELIDNGLKPLIFERGKKIAERSLDIQNFIKARELNPESNIQFGEGGAGSYSDGKLFSRRDKNSSYVNQVLQTFIKFGAPKNIGYISKPHLGTDLLCKIVQNIRAYILERGGKIHYSSKMTDLLITEGKAAGIIINGTQEYLAQTIYIALGHSARDTFEMLNSRGVALESRPISVGVRIEHPVETINLLRYGNKYANFSGLGAATYSLNYTNQTIKRGVYTFCMCPGGEIVNASSSQGLLVLNGMSYSKRSSPFSNAALVVSCHPEDYRQNTPLAGLEFQRDIEQKAFNAGGGKWHVPAQNLMNFLGERNSQELKQNSYKMGAVPADMKEIFPEFVIEQLLAAFNKWQKEVPLFVSNQATVFAAETRTSSPLRVTRNRRFESINTKNLYPLGEGAGYTGGITSSAADAIRAVEIHHQKE